MHGQALAWMESSHRHMHRGARSYKDACMRGLVLSGCLPATSARVGVAPQRTPRRRCGRGDAPIRPCRPGVQGWERGVEVWSLGMLGVGSWGRATL
eukprot:364784-Chlamydomonas_euryale.AAC.16